MSTDADRAISPTGPPTEYLALAAVAVVVGAALTPFTAFVTHLLGYLASSVVCVGLVGAFLHCDTKRRAGADDYQPGGSWITRAWTVVLAAGILVTIWHVWFLARVLATP